MAARVIVLHIEQGEIRGGLWCETCALPSVIESDVLRLSEHGVSKLFTARYCTECHAHS